MKTTISLQVGEPGLGKDLFIKNMFAAYCEDNDLPVNACPPEATAANFQQGPSDFCTEIIVDVDAGRTKIHYLIQVQYRFLCYKCPPKDMLFSVTSRN